MCRNEVGKVLWKWIEEHYMEADFVQRKPYTFVSVVIADPLVVLRGCGFSKFNPNDSKFNWADGRELALKRAKQDVLMQLLKRKEYKELSARIAAMETRT
jgi:hypothetical protein